jgi:hypothetical protein
MLLHTKALRTQHTERRTYSPVCTTWYCCAPLRYSDEHPLVAIAVRLNVESQKQPEIPPMAGRRNRSTMAFRARKSEQGPPNPEQGCYHCLTPEPTAGPSSCMCRWCAHKKSREKMPSGSRAAARKSLGRVKMIYPLWYPGFQIQHGGGGCGGRCGGVAFVPTWRAVWTPALQLRKVLGVCEGAAMPMVRRVHTERRLAELGITLPPVVAPVANYRSCVRSGNLLFTGVAPGAGRTDRCTGIAEARHWVSSVPSGQRGSLGKGLGTVVEGVKATPDG